MGNTYDDGRGRSQPGRRLAGAAHLRWPGTAAVIAAAAVALLAGCGSGVQSTRTHTATTQDTGLHGSIQAHRSIQYAKAVVRATVAKCKSGVMTSTQITTDEKRELVAACDFGYTGHEPAQVHVTSKSVCEELALLVPDESKQAKERAFADCYAIATK